MNSELDNYFRERLRDHSTSPSPTAWDKVENRLSKKNNTAIILRIAAAIAAVGLISIVLLNQSDNSSTQLTQKQTVAEKPVQKVDKPAEQKPISEKNQIAKQTVRESPRRTFPQTESTQQKKNIEPEATLTLEDVVMESIDVEQIAAPQEKPKEKRMVIVYTLPTIKKPADQEALVADAEKKSGFQKVMDVAMEVRASDSPLGPLREAKDDLFAFELKRDKTKTKTNN